MKRYQVKHKANYTCATGKAVNTSWDAELCGVELELEEAT